MSRRTAGDARIRPRRMALPAQRVPVDDDADVVVAGGGPGGFAAALRAARMGVRVVLVEKFDMPGGVHTAGLQGAAGPGAGGIHTELMAAFSDAGHIYTATEDTHPGWAGNPLAHYEHRLKPGAPFARASFNPEGAGNVMARLLEEAGVRALYGAVVVDVIVKRTTGNDTIAAVVVEDAAGRRAIPGRVFVDGTGTAALAARAGAPFVRGGGGQPPGTGWDGRPRPVPGGLLWIMSGVDIAKTIAYQRSGNDPTLANLIAEARAAGDIPPELYRPRMAGSGVYGDAYIGHPTVDLSPIRAPGSYVLWQNVPYDWALHMDDDAGDAARATREMRALIDAEAGFLKKYVPGFGNATLANVGRFVGVRDGRHPVGEHVFSLADVLAGRRFRDAVTRPLTRSFHWDGHRRHTFEVPYRSFLPKKVRNLLLTGASLSFAYETIFMVMRNFPWCTQTGEIAGFAAARAVAKGLSPKELEWTTPYF